MNRMGITLTMETSMSKSGIVTRFCPSPTGFFHIGSARTALFSWAFAKANGGKCVFRCEDTDANRSDNKYLKDIVDGLNWMGLDMEGLQLSKNISKMLQDPAVCQSNRKEIYREWAEKLIKEGKAKKDPESEAILFQLPAKTYFFTDLILGLQEAYEPARDLPIIKSDGNASFHFAVVLDDHLSGITHIFRGMDHLSNTPKHIALYEALGIEPPQYAHMPLINNEKGAKLSKRDPNQKAAISEYIKEGFLPEAVINYLAHLGWSHPERKDIFSKEEFVKSLSLKGMSKSPAKFDLKKMININSHHIEHIVESGEDNWISLAKDYLKEHHPTFLKMYDGDQFDDIIKLIGSRVKKLEDIIDWAEPLVKEEIVYDGEDFLKFVDKEENKELIRQSIECLNMVDIWEPAEIMDCFDGIVSRNEISRNKVIQPVRVATVGCKKSPPIDETLKVLGKDVTIKRLREAISAK